MSADCKVRERLAISKFEKTWYGKIQFQETKRGKISNRYAALENLDDDVDINRAWETIKQNIKISVKEILGYYELK
jgi:hypothetical protein